MTNTSSTGYQAEPAEVEQLATNLLGDILTEKDPAIRYVALAKEQALYDGLVSWLADAKALCAVELYEQPDGSYDSVATALQLGTRGRAQQLVARGRKVHARRPRSHMSHVAAGPAAPTCGCHVPCVGGRLSS